ncbi:MAG TPA: processed acidic surface protein [Planococcus sp. (in: firmicutes)]|nr:processed acidic surface protein [Planococcus sp. (in: firmicutes)]
MKRLFLLILSAALMFGFLPASAFAMEADDKGFDEFLKEIQWEKSAYIDYLESKDYSLENFESADDLGLPITEETIQSVLTEFELSRSELNALLVENGDIEEGQDVLDTDWYLFTEDLSDGINFYLNGGTKITDENLQELIEYYEFESKEELESFLNEQGDTIENYEFIEDLEYAVDDYIYGYDEEYDIEVDIEGMFTELGLTLEELERLEAHLMTLDFENPAFQDRATALADRMMMIEEFESADELTAEQISELIAIYTEMLDLLNLDTKYYLIKGSEKLPITLATLLTLETVDGYDLLVEVYNTQGTFLADFILTNDLFGSDIIKETGEDIKVVEEEVTEEVKEEKNVVVAPPALKTPGKKSEKAPVKKTVKGGKLPKTASDYLPNALFGLAIALAGVALFRRSKAMGL